MSAGLAIPGRNCVSYASPFLMIIGDAKTIALGDEEIIIEKEEYDMIHEKAVRHAEANILNVSTSKEIKNILDERRCTCGCGKGIAELLPLCFNEQNLSILGSGIILFFFYLRHMRMLMFFLFMVYGSLSLITYLVNTELKK